MLNHLLINIFALEPFWESPDINPNNRYVWFWKCLNDIGTRSEGNVIENVSGLDDTLYYIGRDQKVCALNKVGDTENFEIRLRLWESKAHVFFVLDVIWIFEILFNNVEIK